MIRAPPPPNDTARGYHPADIPLRKSREMAQPPTPQLTPASLFTEQAKLDEIRLQVYNRILGTVHQKIKAQSSVPNADQMTSFDVPEWQPGCPRFDVKDCILYIVWNLRHSGFKVLYVSPNRLLISWKEQSIQYYQEESPIRQAMIAATAINKNAKVSTQPAKTEKKKAAAYKPAAEGVAGMLAAGSGSGSGSSKRGGIQTITFI